MSSLSDDTNSVVCCLELKCSIKRKNLNFIVKALKLIKSLKGGIKVQKELQNINKITRKSDYIQPCNNIPEKIYCR